MPYVVVKKATLLIPSGPNLDGQHLYAIVTAPCDQGQCLLTSFSSIKESAYHDDACVAQPGEHPFLKRPSYIEYRLSKIMRCDRISQFVDGWGYTPREALSDPLFERVINGFELSELVPKYILEYYRKNRHR